ncbi:MAG: hypothetical protein NC094_04710 [Bacteroidales bacterium]|nr:hypothetical protein [Lachnoclostridium sp.]MCM1383992.1 hypothetical protein [Lachnoclostridium sp.]MCM1464701.1 hypothetical protein [Bacteroidales bacterium]
MYLKRGEEMQQAADRNDWMHSLRELGFNDEITLQIVNLVQADDTERAAELLRQQKKGLLEELHNSENKVDLLDFLLYQLKKCNR